ncbi:hypothetical protein [Microbacterium sp. P02]|uniref:hypothetical protein n=1 Tax=Microbacterium sp. P02 TaxID=3366260 RepID=UPI00366B85D1
MSAFDPRPLTEPIDRAAVREFVRAGRAEGRLPGAWSSATGILALVFFGVVVLVVGSFFLTIVGSVMSSMASSGGAGFSLLFLIPVLAFGAIAALIVVFAVRGSLGAGGRWYRMSRFAQANGMTYLPAVTAPGLPGMIFSLGSSRASSDVVRGDSPRFAEFANYRYTTGSGKNRTTHKWGYVAIKLDVPLPHIVLDALGNNGLFGSNLPAAFDRDQRLGLEGDFDKHFALYCPEGYERDALYLFTPDIMAPFIDNAAALDVEIIDDWLFLYAKRDFSTLDPATWAWLFSVVGALLDKLAQWARWRDERLTTDASTAAISAPEVASVSDGTPGAASALPFAPPPQVLRPPPGVAMPGRRLKRRFPVAAIVIFALFGIFWFAIQSGVLAAVFSR